MSTFTAEERAAINRALADTAHDNPASQRVLEKAGLRRTSSD
jgi:RimJ/RimL family protein N-acetyltransferase